jgi:hypothetical protein
MNSEAHQTETQHTFPLVPSPLMKAREDIVNLKQISSSLRERSSQVTTTDAHEEEKSLLHKWIQERQLLLINTDKVSIV